MSTSKTPRRESRRQANSPEPVQTYRNPIPLISPRRSLLLLLWGCWWLGLVLWTVGLLTVAPVQMGDSVLAPEYRFPTAKGLHLGVYTLLTVFALCLPGWNTLRSPSLRDRRWFLLLLALHALGTEVGQHFVEGRNGTVWDVLLDLVGITLGVILVPFSNGKLPR